MPGSEGIPLYLAWARVLAAARRTREPERTRGKQIFTIPIVFKRTRLANQPINNVAIIDAVLAASAQPRQLLHLAIAIPDFYAVGLDACFDHLADQTAVHRIRVAINM